MDTELHTTPFSNQPDWSAEQSEQFGFITFCPFSVIFLDHNVPFGVMGRVIWAYSTMTVSIWGFSTLLMGTLVISWRYPPTTRTPSRLDPGTGHFSTQSLAGFSCILILFDVIKCVTGIFGSRQIKIPFFKKQNSKRSLLHEMKQPSYL